MRVFFQHHEANVEAKRKVLAELKHTTKDKELENLVLVKEIEELNVSVNERQHIHEASSKYLYTDSIVKLFALNIIIKTL